MKYIGLFLLIFLISCKKDIELPVVHYLKLNGVSDTLVIDIDNTSKFLLETQITDNEEISQVRLFSSGTSILSPSDSSSFSNFTFSIFENIGSNTYMKADSVSIDPMKSAGLYEINISAVDKEGNEGHGESVNLLLISSESPNTVLTFPDFSGTPSFSAGDTIRIDGSVFDNVAVYKVNTGVFQEDWTTVVTQNFTVTDTVITNWDFQTNSATLVLPTVMDAGNYILKIETGDNDGNLSFFVDTLIIN